MPGLPMRWCRQAKLPALREALTKVAPGIDIGGSQEA